MNIFKTPLLLYGALLMVQSCSSSDEGIKPTHTNLTEAVYASVTIQPVDQYLVYANVSGIIKKVFVEEGDLVTKGQPVFQIENDNPRINADNARLAYDLAKKNVSGNQSPLIELTNQIAAARLKLATDSLNYYRQKNVWENKIGTQNQLDQRLLAYETSKKELAILKNKYGQMQNQLSAQLQQAKNSYQSSVNNSRDFTVTSVMDGKVFSLQKKMGELVMPQEPLAQIGKSKMYVIDMLVDEVDIAKIETGQKVMVRLDAYKDQILEATVSKIYPAMNTRTQTFKVEALFNNPPEVLYPGLTGEANIVISEKRQVLSIPYEYLINGNKVLTDSGEVTVKTGIQNFEHVEIISGIDTTQVIYKPGKK